MTTKRRTNCTTTGCRRQRHNTPVSAVTLTDCVNHAAHFNVCNMCKVSLQLRVKRHYNWYCCCCCGRVVVAVTATRTALSRSAYLHYGRWSRKILTVQRKPGEAFRKKTHNTGCCRASLDPSEYSEWPYHWCNTIQITITI